MCGVVEREAVMESRSLFYDYFCIFIKFSFAIHSETSNKLLNILQFLPPFRLSFSSKRFQNEGAGSVLLIFSS